MSNPSILIVEDEARLLNHLSQTLYEQGFAVSTIATYQDLENLFGVSPNKFDVIVLDRLLQGKDSAALIPKIKDCNSETSILVLSAVNTATEKALVLDLGADDYLSKPFDSEELVARLHVLLRRNKKMDLAVGNVVLNSDRRTIKVSGQETPLQNKEFVLLRTLLKTPGKIFNKTYLYDQVWEMSVEVESNVVETTVNKLRRRLKEMGANVTIKNLRNTGYWIEE